MSSSIWWSDKRLKGKFWYEEFAPILLEIMDKEGTNKIDVKYPHNSIDTYTRAELESDLGVKASKVVQVEALAMYESKLPTFVDFYNFVINNTDPKEVNKSYFKYKLTADIDIQVNYDRIIHIYNKHNLTALVAQQLLEGLKKVKLASVSSKQGELAGTTILCQVLNGEGGVALIKGKTLCLGTLFIGGAKEVEDWVKKEGPYALLNVSTNGSFIGDLLGQVTASYRPSILLSANPDKSQPNYYNFTEKGLNSTERVVAHRATTSSFDPKEYEEYLEKHIGNVQKAYEFLVETGIVDFDEQVDELMQQHDQSKYEKVEFNPYGERFYGKFKGSEEDDPNFRYAWLHHQHNNPHHWQYWCLLEDEGKGKVECLDMPEKYIIEMVCDWLAFSIDKNDLGEVEKWYKENKSNQLLSEKTRARVEALLESIKENKESYKPQASIKRVVAKDKRNIVERRGARQDIPNARDSEFDSGVYEMLRDNPKLMGYIEPWMDVAQVSVIEEALEAGVDVSKLQSPKYNWMQMNAILEYLKEGIDVTKYTKEGRDEGIIRQIGEAIKQGMTEVQIRQMLFMKNWMQMREIRLGHKMGINVQSYATKPQMGWQQMRDIRMRLIKEQAHLTASWMPVQAMAIKHKKSTSVQ